MNLNTLTDFPCRKRYYLTHPWEWIKHLVMNIKDFWSRGTKGFAPRDVWDFDSWFCSVVPPMLRYMTDHGSAYPGKEPFDTPEKWHNWLYEIAERIETLQYDKWLDKNNEFTEEYYKSLDSNPNITFSDVRPHEVIRDLYYKRNEELEQIRLEVLLDIFTQLSKYFDLLWD